MVKIVQTFEAIHCTIGLGDVWIQIVAEISDSRAKCNRKFLLTETEDSKHKDIFSFFATLTLPKNQK